MLMTRPKAKKPLYPLVAFRLPEELIEQLDAITDQLTRERPGMKASRSSTIRVLLEAAIRTKAWKN